MILDTRARRRKQSTNSTRIGTWWHIQKRLILSLIIAFVTFIVVLFIPAITSLTDVHLRIVLSPQWSFDLFGAILPAITGIVFFVMSLWILRFSVIRYGALFCVSVTSILVFTSVERYSFSNVAVIEPVQVMSFLMSIIVASIVFAGGSSSKKSKTGLIMKLKIAKRKYLLALLVMSSCFPLGSLFVDISVGNALSSFVGHYVGGAGLNDGIFISALISPLAITCITASIIVIQEFLKNEKKKL